MSGSHDKLKKVFNIVASAGAGAITGIVVRSAVKTAAFALFGSTAIAAGASIVASAAAIGTVSAAIQRGQDVRAWNKAHDTDKVAFFDFEKTGHSTKHYLKKGGLSAGFALAGSMAGFLISDWVHGAHAAAPHIAATHHAAPPVAVLPPVHVPTPDENLANLIAQAKGHVPAQHCAMMNTVLHRLDSTHVAVRAQAVKDMGYYYANGFCGVTKDSTLADKLFQGAITISHGHNMQATRDLGYQLLHGFGATADHGRAWELLNRSAAHGDRLSPPMIAYMKLHHLAPGAR